MHSIEWILCAAMHSSMGGFLLFFNLQFRSVSVSRGGIFSKAAAAVSGMLSSLGCRPHWDNDSEKHRNGDSKKLSFKQVTRLNIGHRNFECPLIISALAYQSSKKENSSLQGELFLCAHGAAVVQHPTHPPHSPSLAHALRCTHTCTRMARSGSSTLPSTPLPCARARIGAFWLHACAKCSQHKHTRAHRTSRAGLGPLFVRRLWLRLWRRLREARVGFFIRGGGAN